MTLVKLFSFLIIGASFMSFKTVDCNNSNTGTHTRIYSSVKWKTDVVDLGEIPQSKPVTIEFEFTNTSNADVIVANAQASCGCTVADYPKTPIAAGKTAKITATFNAATKGAFTKNVTVTIQNEEAKVLNFKGTVI
jgi:outer membrane lipoprotein SlyB